MCGWFAGTFCRDFCRTLHMFGTHHCCNSSSSCLSETCELAPASAGAERRTFVIECAVRALRSASDIARAAVALEDTPTTVSLTPHLRGNVIGLFKRTRLAADQTTTTETESTRFHRSQKCQLASTPIRASRSNRQCITVQESSSQ